MSIFTVSDWIRKLFAGIKAKNFQDRPSRSDEINMINEQINIRLRNLESGMASLNFSRASVNAFAGAIEAYRARGGILERQRECYFLGNLIQRGIIEGNFNDILGTLDDAIIRTRRALINAETGMEVHQAEILSRNIRNIIMYDFYINDALIREACLLSGLLEIIEPN